MFFYACFNFVFDLICNELPDLKTLPGLPKAVEDYLDEMDEEGLTAMLIELVGRWDEPVDESV